MVYYLGIVGARSSLGKAVIARLEEQTQKYKIVFKVDDRYSEKNIAAGEFQNLEQVLSCNLNASLILDFGTSSDAFERAQFYRSYGMPTVMQSVFGSQKNWELQNIRESSGAYSPLILVPDFSIIKVLMINNLKAQLKYCDTDLSRINIDVLYNTERYNYFNQWLHWARGINEQLGNPTELFRQDGHTLNFGRVQYGFLSITSLGKNEESINIQIISAQKETVFRWEMIYDLLTSRVKGVMLLLSWYFENYPDILAQNEHKFWLDVLPDLV